MVRKCGATWAAFAKASFGCGYPVRSRGKVVRGTMAEIVQRYSIGQHKKASSRGVAARH